MNREIYVTDEALTICPISEDDKEKYFELRIQVSDIPQSYSDPEMREMFWKTMLSYEDEDYSIFDENNDYCGNLIMQNPSSETPEIGIDLLENKRNKGIAVRAIKLVSKKFYEENTVEYFLIKAVKENTHSRHMIEKTGAVFTGMEESPYKKLLKKCIDSVSGTDCEGMKLRFEKELDEYKNMPDNVCVYKLMPETFM